MEKNLIGEKIKALRISKGYSQEHLSTLTGLNLRTIQRIENGETEPRGDSLKRLAEALDVGIGELTGKNIRPVTYNKDLLVLNLLGLGCLLNFFPLLGIILPLIYWFIKKNELAEEASQARIFLNFQITMSLFFVLLIIQFVLATLGYVSIMGFMVIAILPVTFSVIMIIYNAIRISKSQEVKYWPVIRFLR